jgi:4-amino-4-deoxy-L-arabinose transferase-like glycosyltransferase
MKRRTIIVLLVAILLLATGLRVGLLVMGTYRGTFITPDSQDYMSLANNLRYTGGFERDGQPEIFRTPGYPVFLMVTAFWLGEGNGLVALGVQVALDVLLVGLVFVMGRQLVGNGAGLLAATLQAVSPLAVAYSTRVLSDSLFALLFTVALVLLIAHLRRGGWAWLVTSAAIMVAAIYVRPVGQVLAVVMAIGVLLGRDDFWKNLAKGVAFLVVVAVGLSPWVIRNKTTADYMGFSSFASDSFYYYAYPELLAWQNDAPAEAVRLDVQHQSQSHQFDSPGQAARWRKAQAVSALKADPGTYFQLHVLGTLGAWLPGGTEVLEVAGVTAGERGTIDVIHRDGIWAGVKHYFSGNRFAMALMGGTILITIIRYAGVLLWLIGRLRPSMSRNAWLLGGLVIITVLLPGPFGLPRYRLPILPILSVASGAGWWWLFAPRRSKKRHSPSSAS